jgi:hypothetical protein
MSRTILYYPSITIQSPGWIRKSILYWDRIGTMIPRDFDTEQYFNEDMRILSDKGLLVPLYPEEHIKKRSGAGRGV